MIIFGVLAYWLIGSCILLWQVSRDLDIGLFFALFLAVIASWYWPFVCTALYFGQNDLDWSPTVIRKRK